VRCQLACKLRLCSCRRTTDATRCARPRCACSRCCDGCHLRLRLCSGYCFDGTTSCFNPFPVLLALDAGRLTATEMAAASGTDWLGLTPGAVLQDAFFLAESIPRPADDLVDLAGFNDGRVHAVPLLLQTGLLSLIAGDAEACRPPNKYARVSLQRMLESALAVKTDTLPLPALAAALEARDRAAFQAEATRLLEVVPNALIKVGVPREAPFHGALLGAILASVGASATVVPEMQFQRGRTDIVVTFPLEPAATWIFEVGRGDSASELRSKHRQAEAYALGLSSSTTVTCCAILAGEPKPASAAAKRAGTVFGFSWSQRQGAGAAATWAEL